MNKRILIISDSHGENKLMQQILKQEKADLVVHAGDYCVDIEWMKKHFNYFVDGNNDYSWAPIQVFSFANFKFLLTHGSTEWSFDYEKWIKRLRELGQKHNVDVVIFGHSHKPEIDTNTKPYIVNPGSITLPRNDKHQKSYMIGEVDNDTINFLIKYVNEGENE